MDRGLAIVQRFNSMDGNRGVLGVEDRGRNSVLRVLGGVVREVSANSSLRRLILSFKPSASRLAAVILACICSPVMSAAILTNWGP